MARPNVNSFIHVTSAYRLPIAEENVGVSKNMDVVGTKAINYTRTLVMTQNDVANSYAFTCVHSSNELHKIHSGKTVPVSPPARFILTLYCRVGI